MRALVLVTAATVITACGGGGDGGTPPPATVSTVAITPATAQSITIGGTAQFSAQPRDAQGNNLTRTVTWTNSDASKVSLSATTGASVTATGVAAGTSNIRATADGVQSTQVTVTVAAAGPPPQTASVTATANSTFDPAAVTIAAGGTVTWTFVATPAHNVTFSGATPTGGNIATTSNTSVERTFPTAGSYPYSCTLHAGMNGTVTVQ